MYKLLYILHIITLFSPNCMRDRITIDCITIVSLAFSQTRF